MKTYKNIVLLSLIGLSLIYSCTSKEGKSANQKNEEVKTEIKIEQEKRETKRKAFNKYLLSLDSTNKAIKKK